MVNIAVGIQGTQGLVQLQRQLQELHSATTAINTASAPVSRGINAIAGNVVTPWQGFSQGRNEYMEYSREILDHSRNVRELTRNYEALELSVARAATNTGRMAREMEAVRNSLNFLPNGQSLITAEGISNWSRGTGINFQQAVSSQRSLLESGALSSQDYYRLADAVAEGALRGSTQGYVVASDRFMSMITAATQQQQLRSGTSNLEGTSRILSGFNASGENLLRMERGGGVLGRLDQTFATSSDPFIEMTAFNALRASNPTLDYFQFQRMREQGIRDPQILQAVLTQYSQMFGTNRDVFLGKSGFGVNVSEAGALFRAADMGYLSGSNPAADAMLAPFRSNQANLGLIDLGVGAAYGKFNSLPGGGFNIDEAAAAYQSATNQEFDRQKYGTDVAGFIRGTAEFKGPLNGQFPDQVAYQQAELSNDYLTASQNFKEAIQSVNDMSILLKDIARMFAQDFGDGNMGFINGGNAGGMALGSQVIGGIGNSLASAAAMAYVFRGFSGGGWGFPRAGAGAGRGRGGGRGGGRGTNPLMAGGGGGMGVLGAAGPQMFIASNIYSEIDNMLVGDMDSDKDEAQLYAEYADFLKRREAGELRPEERGWAGAMTSWDYWLHPGRAYEGETRVAKWNQMAEAERKAGITPGSAMPRATSPAAGDTGFIGPVLPNQVEGMGTLINSANEQIRLLTSIDRKLDYPVGQVATDQAYQMRYGAGPMGGPNAILSDPAISAIPGVTIPTSGTTGTRGVPGVGFGTMTGSQINSFIQGQTGGKSAFGGMGDTIAALSQKYGVPASLVLALLTKESSLGTNGGALAPYHNWGGITATQEQIAAGRSVRIPGVDRDFLTFGSNEEYLEYMFQFLVGSDYYNGTSLEELIGNYFAGPQAYGKYGTGAGDGPGGSVGSNGSVQDYINLVLDIIEKATGRRPSQGDIPIGRGSTPSAAPGATGTGRRGFMFPNGGTITQGPNGGFSHGGLNAVDIAGGGSIFAPMGGTVTGIYNGIAGTTGGSGLGNYIEVTGEDGVVYRIGHLAGGGMQGLGIGSAIGQGQYIGEMGSTGYSTGTHAHVQTMNKGMGELSVIDWLTRLGAISPEMMSGAGGTGGDHAQDHGEPMNVEFAPLEVIVRNAAGEETQREYLPLTILRRGNGGWTEYGGNPFGWEYVQYGKKQVR